MVTDFKNIKISIIIVTYNDVNDIGNCLDSLYSDNIEYEIILVDNCSNDGTVQYVRKKYPSVIIVENNHNYGLGTGINLGVKIAKGDYIIVLNSDTVVESNWFVDLLNPVIHEDYVITTPKILLYDGSKINTCGNVNHFTGFAFTRGLNMPVNAYSKDEYVDGISGCCFAIKRKDYLKLNGFDENFFLYNEDTDFSWKCRSQGYKILYVASSIIRHKYEFNITPMKLFNLERGRYIILRKYLTWKQFLIFLPSLIISEVLSIGLSSKLGLAGLSNKLKAMQKGIFNQNDYVSYKKMQYKGFGSVVLPFEQFKLNTLEKYLLTIFNGIYKLNFYLYEVAIKYL